LAKVVLHMSWHPYGAIAFDAFNDGWGTQRHDLWPMWKREIVRTDIVTTDKNIFKVCYFYVVYTWYDG